MVFNLFPADFIVLCFFCWADYNMCFRYHKYGLYLCFVKIYILNYYIHIVCYLELKWTIARVNICISYNSNLSSFKKSVFVYKFIRYKGANKSHATLIIDDTGFLLEVVSGWFWYLNNLGLFSTGSCKTFCD